MANALAFDTLAYAKKLIAAGVSEKQAEVQAETLAGVIEEQLATKRDLKELEVSLKHDMKEIEVSLKHDMKELEVSLRHDINELKRDIKELEMRITVRLGVMLAASIAIVAALVKLI